MAELSWQAGVDIVRPHVVRIMTPRGSGTGFLLFNSKVKDFCAVATAAHVISAAHFWEEPARVEHLETGETDLLRVGDRAVLLDDQKDVAAIVFNRDRLPLPDTALTLSPKDTHIRAGVEIGWLGFPAVSTEFCFFSGRVSAYLGARARYLVDGVAINGVSGGPAFTPFDSRVDLVGVVSAYIPNRATGEVLPGLAVVTDVSEFHKMIAAFESLEQAQSEQTPPTAATAAPSQEPSTPPAPGGDGAP